MASVWIVLSYQWPNQFGIEGVYKDLVDAYVTVGELQKQGVVAHYEEWDVE